MVEQSLRDEIGTQIQFNMDNLNAAELEEYKGPKNNARNQTPNEEYGEEEYDTFDVQIPKMENMEFSEFMRSSVS